MILDQETSFDDALEDWMGLCPGTNLSDFMAVLKALTDEDRADLRKELERVGYKLKP